MTLPNASAESPPKSEAPARVFEMRVKGDATGFRAALAAEGIEAPEGNPEMMRLFVPDTCTPQSLFRLAAQHQLQVRHLRGGAPTLEDVFERVVEHDS